MRRCWIKGPTSSKLIVPAGPDQQLGVIYDYLRLELDDPVAASATALPQPVHRRIDSISGCDGAPGAIGWGKHLGTFFDPSKLKVANFAREGRSSRTFVAERLWDRLLEGVKAGDVVLIQFGHNDGGPINDERRARGSLPGLWDESQEIDNLVTKQHEVVHTFSRSSAASPARAGGSPPPPANVVVGQ